MSNDVNEGQVGGCVPQIWCSYGFIIVDFAPLEEVDGTADEASKMEEVDRSEACVRRKYRLARIHTPTG